VEQRPRHAPLAATVDVATKPHGGQISMIGQQLIQAHQIADLDRADGGDGQGIVCRNRLRHAPNHAGRIPLSSGQPMTPSWVSSSI
jgi:hypothetical protein